MVWPSAAILRTRSGCSDAGLPIRKNVACTHSVASAASTRGAVGAPSNRRGKKPDCKGEQQKSTECINCDIYRTGHWKITRLTTIGSGCELTTGSVDNRGGRAGHHDWFSGLIDAPRMGVPVAARVAG